MVCRHCNNNELLLHSSLAEVKVGASFMNKLIKQTPHCLAPLLLLLAKFGSKHSLHLSVHALVQMSSGHLMV